MYNTNNNTYIDDLPFTVTKNKFTATKCWRGTSNYANLLTSNNQLSSCSNGRLRQTQTANSQNTGSTLNADFSQILLNQNRSCSSLSCIHYINIVLQFNVKTKSNPSHGIFLKYQSANATMLKRHYSYIYIHIHTITHLRFGNGFVCRFWYNYWMFRGFESPLTIDCEHHAAVNMQ